MTRKLLLTICPCGTSVAVMCRDAKHRLSEPLFMTEILRCRVDKKLLKAARQVSEEMGTSTAELIRIFLKALVETRQLPFVLKVPQPDPERLLSKEARNKIWKELDDSEAW